MHTHTHITFVEYKAEQVPIFGIIQIACVWHLGCVCVCGERRGGISTNLRLIPLISTKDKCGTMLFWESKMCPSVSDTERVQTVPTFKMNYSKIQIATAH